MYSTPPWALVTGASGEIGQAISLALAERGIPLYLHYHQSPHKVEPILQACHEKGVPAYAFQADLRQTDQIAGMFAAMITPPLLIVNNASVDHVGLFADVSPMQFDDLIATNVRSAFFVTQAALPAMLRERFGRIVNISSIWGMTGASCEVLYSLGKGAVNSFTKALAKELAPNGITVNAVAPGAIQGGMMNRFSPEEVSMLASEIPAGRLGTPEEVAAVARFLLSAEAGYVTGQIISPNGGWYA
ncbi:MULTISPECIES: elongation factor P 5-aminopentanone reductase [Brevibacillus]|jgi:3-oxoacyl-[acyl-carrier protein] reductase|uniref:elongation factor P 5-aminopentanone reductase n=1 Tax=Brevibacillus TaxID=55080 RepID=UPI00046B0590|nr:SDR family oxidoreductase [Brevibacillus borstelensis]KKX53934.1 3-ketoacyl-ACP reductase [Brevibacillus borstelensis cifa_chp40]MBE5397955.1 SDR family oxidoreductase [Brevibacillus borstelensis]MCC0563531.1 SDR family oxidoreductase [Brevibacillus borstelensis]MCM3469660.1 SDR family oxidoreductase [Brevibacillus borstelensis]MCM3557912.1 SDR family oxidoreductase [Brevibacillus borstelensis]